MKVEVLGTGCPKCRKLYALVQEALSELGVSAELVKVEKIQDIMKFNVMLTPALVVDGVVKCAGKIPSKDEIKRWVSGK